MFLASSGLGHRTDHKLKDLCKTIETVRLLGSNVDINEVHEVHHEEEEVVVEKEVVVVEDVHVDLDNRK